MTRKRRQGPGRGKNQRFDWQPSRYDRGDKEHCRMEGIPQWERRYGRSLAGGVIYSAILLTRIGGRKERRDRRGRVPARGAPRKVREYREDLGGMGWVKV